MSLSVILFLAALAFVNCNDVSNKHLGPMSFEFKKSSEVVVLQDELLQGLTDDVQQRNLITDSIKDLIESFRDDIDDPLIVDHLGPFKYSAGVTLITANIWKLQSTGQAWYTVDYVTFNPLRLTMGIHATIPWLTVTSEYDASARILLISHKSGGNIRIFLNRIEVGADLRLGTNILGGGHLTLRELAIKIDIHDSHIQINGLVGSSVLNSLINSLVQGISQELIQSEMENVSNLISEALFEVINDILKNFKLEDILGK